METPRVIGFTSARWIDASTQAGHRMPRGDAQGLGDAGVTDRTLDGVQA